MKDWERVVTSIEQCNLGNVDNVIAIDETGTPTLKNINETTPTNKIWFGITGIVIEKESINNIMRDFMVLKNKYWQNGDFNNKRVVFHSRDIRKRVGPFNPKHINYHEFRKDLDMLIEKIPFQTAAALIDKQNHVAKYVTPYPVYDLTLEYLLERLVFRLNFLNENCVLLIESREKKEDKELLQDISFLISHGNQYINAERFSCIKGIYFDKKRTRTKQKSYWPLELADIVSYRIFRSKTELKDIDSFKTIETKIINYPDYDRKGIKIF